MSSDYITFTIGKKKNIALIAHDNEKPKLISWQKGKTEDSYTLSLSMEFYMYENVTEYMAGQAAAAEAAAAEAEKQPEDSLTEE